jgi:hypothetical protein
MKIQELKQEVYRLTQTESTKELRKVRSELVQGKDLRRKDSWQSIFNTLKLVGNFEQEQLEKDIHKKYDFKNLGNNPSFNDIIHNLQSVAYLENDLESKFNEVEKTHNINYDDINL